MTKRLDIQSPMIVPTQEDPLSDKLMEIVKERQALQLRTQELVKMVRLLFFLDFYIDLFMYI